jgi:hypothetical protein
VTFVTWRVTELEILSPTHCEVEAIITQLVVGGFLPDRRLWAQRRSAAQVRSTIFLMDRTTGSSDKCTPHPWPALSSEIFADWTSRHLYLARNFFVPQNHQTSWSDKSARHPW